MSNKKITNAILENLEKAKELINNVRYENTLSEDDKSELVNAMMILDEIYCKNYHEELAIYNITKIEWDCHNIYHNEDTGKVVVVFEYFIITLKNPDDPSDYQTFRVHKEDFSKEEYFIGKKMQLPEKN